MRRRIGLAVVTLVLGVLGSEAQAQDRWLGADKGLHFGVSAVLVTGAYAGASFVSHEPFQRALFGAGVGVAFGVGKEVWDATGRGDPSLRDLTWDIVGCGFGVGLALLVDHAFRPPGAVAGESREPSVLLRW